MASALNAVLGGIGLLVDATTGIANSASQVANAQTNRDLARQQLELAKQQVRANEQLVQGWANANNPAVRYREALDAGFDQQSAAMLAGRGTPRIVGMSALGPITVAEANGLAGTQLASRASMLAAREKGGPTLPSGPIRRGSTSSVWSNSTQSSWLSSASGNTGHWSVPSVGSLGTPSHPRPVVVVPGRTASVWTPSSTV